jgi:hypothetical protein
LAAIENMLFVMYTALSSMAMPGKSAQCELPLICSTELMANFHQPALGSDVFDTATRMRESVTGLPRRSSATTTKRPLYWS